MNLCSLHHAEVIRYNVMTVLALGMDIRYDCRYKLFIMDVEHLQYFILCYSVIKAVKRREEDLVFPFVNKAHNWYQNLVA